MAKTSEEYVSNKLVLEVIIFVLCNREASQGRSGTTPKELWLYPEPTRTRTASPP